MRRRLGAVLQALLVVAVVGVALLAVGRSDAAIPTYQNGPISVVATPTPADASSPTIALLATPTPSPNPTPSPTLRPPPAPTRSKVPTKSKAPKIGTAGAYTFPVHGCKVVYSHYHRYYSATISTSRSDAPSWRPRRGSWTRSATQISGTRR